MSIKMDRRRICEELGVCQGIGCATCQHLSASLLSYLSAPDAPGQRGNVWFAGPEPEPDAPKASHDQPLSGWVERLALVLLLGVALASVLAAVAVVAWLFSLEGWFA